MALITPIAITATLTYAIPTPPPATATLTRPFLPEITATPASRTTPNAVAVDAENHLWVGEGEEDSVAEFNPANIGDAPPTRLRSIKVSTLPSSVAVERATTGDFYVASSKAQETPIEVLSSTGAHLETWRPFEEPYIAIDNSTEPLTDPSACGAPPLAPSECFVYVSLRGTDPTVHAVKKLNSRGQPVAFAYATACAQDNCKYVNGNELNGRPAGTGCGDTFTLTEHPAADAVDAEGNIYVAVPPCARIFEYRASGEYVQAFELEREEVPRLEGQVGLPEGIAVNPVSNHLLVVVTADRHNGTTAHALYEFDTETGEFVSEITEASEQQLP